MEGINNTAVKYFILLTLTDYRQYELLLFLTFLLIYIICLIGNIAIILITKMDHSLHTPMYFFISMFGTCEIFFVSSVVPVLLSNLIADMKSISFTGCFVQVCAIATFGATECYLLAVMAFDRDLAINYPLHYSRIMRRDFCILLVVLPWALCIINALIATFFTTGYKYCGSNKLNHFMCELGPLQHVACVVPPTNRLTVTITEIYGIVLPFCINILMYIHIITTIVRIRGEKSKRKAFSTCSSHITVATLFYGTASIAYMVPQTNNMSKYLSLIYSLVTPSVNPFIYTLRNKDVVTAFRKLSKRIS
ncbi:hypothetical protein GDO86_016465 [Hymenochirus boettgeri]|uniref:G-protein coupled receptors family 1 profile domain-containing protein n=1 Tax=Hymenochirus boettgeri TaxID=247094 RepID=A0A8T2K0F9_9PIPI|nr:hypothetical protein GDO86_019419 [Hymenochirus boettgeri]KAG8449808.1 hypothetical protein GDO86_016465 [Hymenochirus boettgeri]